MYYKLLFYNLFILSILLSACERATQLNSERIAARFGNVGIEILQADDRRRVSSLYSVDPDGRTRTMRTLALVEFLGAGDPAVKAEHAAIVAGGSIGEVFSQHGWRIEKLGTRQCRDTPDTASLPMLRDMRLTLPRSLATNRYLFRVHRNGKTVDYATITEIYHPGFVPPESLGPCQTTGAYEQWQ
jgi:hypothetical protein